jgi:transposase
VLGKFHPLCLEKFIQHEKRLKMTCLLYGLLMLVLGVWMAVNTIGLLTCLRGEHIITQTVIRTTSQETAMAKQPSRRRTPRQLALSAQGATHPNPQAVIDPLFRDSAFFDPNDVVQVKYEMLRSVQLGTLRVVQAAAAFGLSRPVFYVTQELFDREGLPGLLPHKRGPKQPHKLNDDTLAVLAQAVQAAQRILSGEELAVVLAQRCGIEAHPRSILRRLVPYLKRQEKKRR